MTDNKFIFHLDDDSPVNTTGFIELAGSPREMHSLHARVGGIIMRPGYDPEYFEGMEVVDPAQMRHSLELVHSGLKRELQDYLPCDRLFEIITVT